VDQTKVSEMFSLIKGKLTTLITNFQSTYDRVTPKKSNSLPKRSLSRKNSERYVKLDTENLDLIANILIGVKRSLTNFTIIPGKQLDDLDFSKKLSSQIDWVS